jgi:glutaminyl-peptide cyclotransferase
MRAAMCTAIPAMSLSSSSHSPVWMPARISTPSVSADCACCQPAPTGYNSGMRIPDGSGWLAVAAVVMLTLGSAVAYSQPQTVPVVTPVVLAEIPHDPGAFTQGLELDSTSLYEGTGLVGRSEMRELDPATGAVRRAVPVPNNYFGEGITVVGDRIWQLTYRDGVAVQWDKATLTPLREVPLNSEGWGLCRDGDRLISSDGTDRLHFRDGVNLTETGAVAVTRDGQPLTGLNELECVDGQVWANVWPTNTIARIDPATGMVNVIVDASKLWPGGQPANAQVLNGIAHIDGEDFLLTGKFWPSTFRVRVNPTQ